MSLGRAVVVLLVSAAVHLALVTLVTWGVVALAGLPWWPTWAVVYGIVWLANRLTARR